MAVGGVAWQAASLSGCGPNADAVKIGAQEQPPGKDLYPARRDPRFLLDRPVTDAA